MLVYQSLTAEIAICVSVTEAISNVASAPPPAIVTVSPTRYPVPPALIVTAVTAPVAASIVNVAFEPPPTIVTVAPTVYPVPAVLIDTV